MNLICLCLCPIFFSHHFMGVLSINVCCEEVLDTLRGLFIKKKKQDGVLPIGKPWTHVLQVLY